ncbi:P-loop containing nucleoside triphosphate hydrolase protein [Ilyonectria destructans]|nr:P-loop containing nucleoside triphosphate hydrolase protein [Ilyonectria destructans]
MSFSFGVPEHTPRSTPSRNRRSLVVNADSPHDSGVDGLSNNESSPSRVPDKKEEEPQEGPDDSSSASFEDFLVEDLEKGNPVTENPFSTERGRILFEAIDQLQSFECSKKLEIPQLIVVGGQSSGKSSLLQRLTGIPFPVGTGTCTRFPTRITSKRTPPKSKDSFRISIEPAEVTVHGLERAPDTISSYACTGEIFTAEVFAKAVKEVSSKYIGIRHGKNEDSNNFAAEVLKVELSGPNRPYFSILDLPGLFNSTYSVKTADGEKVEEMIVKYMQKPENTVICVVDASVDFIHQPILEVAQNHINDRERILGVFTKCDKLENNLEEAQEAADIAVGFDLKFGLKLTEDDPRLMSDGWFVVRNRNDKDKGKDHFELEASEKDLLSTFPWDRVPEPRRGCAALKTHLGTILDSKITSSFPAIQEHVERNLQAKLSEEAMLGEPRGNHHARLNYATNIAKNYDELAIMALDRPGRLPTPVMELRQEVSRLNREFDSFMRARGAEWEFQDYDISPAEKMKEIADIDRGVVSETSTPPRREIPDFDPAFNHCIRTGNSDKLLEVIKQKLKGVQTNQLPGIINPDIFPIMYKLQVSKWVTISNIHLQRVSNAVLKCIDAILESVCPSKGGTARLHAGLKEMLKKCFDSAGKTAKQAFRIPQRQETECETLGTTDDKFVEDIVGWRKMRFQEACLPFLKPGLSNIEALSLCFDCAHPTLEKNMVNEVHDVLKVYYKISLEAFIRSIIGTIEAYVSSDEGPVKGLQSARMLELSEEHLNRIAGEDQSTYNKRLTLATDIEELKEALAIVERARQETEGLM